jgi:hypothetical protein
VLGNGRLGERQFLDDFTANAAAFPHEKAQDLHTRGVPDRLGELGQFLVRLRALDRP